jgi:nitrogen fixation-related uncharacterized protein
MTGDLCAKALREAMRDIFVILIPVSLAAVAATLGFGIYALFRGGDFGRTWSNKLMRLRVALQFCAIIVLVAAFLWRSKAHG